METVILILELIGTVAFSMSGALLGIRKNLDIFGILVMGVTTSVGGGFIRDITIGTVPPVMFSNPIYCVTALLTAAMMCIPCVRRLLSGRLAYNVFMIGMDSVGLAVFTVMGVIYTYKYYPDKNFLMIFTGVVCGIGGGVLRDILAGELPYILRKHIYACAAIAGAVCAAVMLKYFGSVRAAVLSGVPLIILIRAVAAYFRINLPHINDNDETEQ